MRSEPKVLIIILNWNQYELTRQTLCSLNEITYSDYEILLVDNGSTDDSFARLKKDFPGMHTLAAGENLGVSGGRNAGIDFARDRNDDYLLFLDNDVIVAEDFLGRLVEALESHPAAGGGQSLVFHFDRPDLVCSAGGSFFPLICHHRTRRTNSVRQPIQDDRPVEIDWLGGVVQLYKKAVFSHIDGFDEDYHPYGCEDAQMGLDVKRKGYSLLLVPGSRIWHRAKAGNDWLEFKTKNNASAMVLFLRKNTHRANFVFAFLWHLVNYVLRYSFIFLLRGRFTQLRALMAGLRQGWTKSIP